MPARRDRQGTTACGLPGFIQPIRHAPLSSLAFPVRSDAVSWASRVGLPLSSLPTIIGTFESSGTSRCFSPLYPSRFGSAYGATMHFPIMRMKAFVLVRDTFSGRNDKSNRLRESVKVRSNWETSRRVKRRRSPVRFRHHDHGSSSRTFSIRSRTQPLSTRLSRAL